MIKYVPQKRIWIQYRLPIWWPLLDSATGRIITFNSELDAEYHLAGLRTTGQLSPLIPTRIVARDTAAWRQTRPRRHQSRRRVRRKR